MLKLFLNKSANIQLANESGMYTDFFTFTLANYFYLNYFLYKSPSTKAAIFAFWHHCG